MYLMDGKATGYRVNLDVGYVSSQTNVYPISDLSCMMLQNDSSNGSQVFEDENSGSCHVLAGPRNFTCEEQKFASKHT